MAINSSPLFIYRIQNFHFNVISLAIVYKYLQTKNSPVYYCLQRALTKKKGT
jgi:hypothetical protein